MSKVYVLSEQQGMTFRNFGAVSSLEVANRFEMLKSIKANQNHYYFYKSLELDDPELLNRIAKESKPYRGAINIPCSPCGDGDKNLKYHDHDHVSLENRRK